MHWTRMGHDQKDLLPIGWINGIHKFLYIVWLATCMAPFAPKYAYGQAPLTAQPHE